MFSVLISVMMPTIENNLNHTIFSKIITVFKRNNNAILFLIELKLI